ncbi:MAG: DUF2238 domain-containing protein [Gemmatimonadetes bacterium]|uniref:DUF2238 domain-containing protein n=1 Tax=Candidatus Kutchimonas denitrificans TaxID=3056748 RepID=A0AAE4Z525_9BACT|nr:DUF2238 domain-containing protein [Gemmatimonadota bacterium]NIR73673.1 DUF2238 domain-containing protein [Candidatus Kutchimonas denitrificans]NIS00723.1 DUF2238 domain-containing protein [Gemmatimonadota bacterium]NIT66310.1 DUF2238 domain-containing protein [Gemmatimonadota bacterium]NIU51528.1 DUF2238 domain-containing protein [Gemmatimonadota bacterium]
MVDNDRSAAFTETGAPAGRFGGSRLLPVAAFTFTYLAAALVLGIARGNLEFLFYIAVMLILIGCVWLVDRSVSLKVVTLWGLSLWGLAHMAGGLLTVPESWPVSSPSRVLYTLWLIPERLKYDQVIHAYGFGITTWVCWQGLRSAIRRRGGSARPTFGLMVLAATAAIGFSALNEVVEFVATLLVPETNVGGYRNTGWDLVANMTGATIAATIIWLTARKGER